jgi:hypothetical protein
LGKGVLPMHKYGTVLAMPTRQLKVLIVPNLTIEGAFSAEGYYLLYGL